eukprot:Filipodium_phascolosomae@DN2748_c4_g1_i5.p1
METPEPSPAVLRRLQRYAAGRVTCVDGVFVEGCSASGAAYSGYQAAPVSPSRKGRRDNNKFAGNFFESGCCVYNTYHNEHARRRSADILKFSVTSLVRVIL